ncbi:MAG: YcxB family protein [Leptospiraceae bacterium]|nr:YcxB family protein [Leptospiraceae bacterium]MCP5512055.1 YcxB family protein [Leptospiraceae bacterium]
MVEIEFSLSKEDYLVYQLYASSQSKVIKSSRFKNWLLIPILYLILGVILNVVLGQIYLFALSIIAVLWVLLYPFYSKYTYTKNYIRNIDEIYGERFGKVCKIIITMEYLIMELPAEETKLKFPEVVQITEINDYFFLGLRNDSAIIIPKLKVDYFSLLKFMNQLTEKTNVTIYKNLTWKWK